LYWNDWEGESEVELAIEMDFDVINPVGGELEACEDVNVGGVGFNIR